MKHETVSIDVDAITRETANVIKDTYPAFTLLEVRAIVSVVVDEIRKTACKPIGGAKVCRNCMKPLERADKWRYVHDAKGVTIGIEHRHCDNPQSYRPKRKPTAANYIKDNSTGKIYIEFTTNENSWVYHDKSEIIGFDIVESDEVEQEFKDCSPANQGHDADIISFSNQLEIETEAGLFSVSAATFDALFDDYLARMCEEAGIAEGDRAFKTNEAYDLSRRFFLCGLHAGDLGLKKAFSCAVSESETGMTGGNSED